MPAKVNSVFKSGKSVTTVERILKPKWLDGVVVSKSADSYTLNLWKAGYVVIPFDAKLKSAYGKRGSWDKRELNLIGDNMISFTTKVGMLEVYQCFSISKPVLFNRVKKDGDGAGHLFSRYEENDNHGVLISGSADKVVLHADISIGEELLVNGIPISVSTGPDAISKIYGKPDFKVSVAKGKGYRDNKSISISNIKFIWGDSTCKHSIALIVDVLYKEMFLEITVR